MWNDYANILSKPGGYHRDLRQRLADAASTLAAPSDPHLRTIYNIGRWVAAPLLVPYVLWVLSDASRLGLNRLYFISRDGQILLRIAQQLVTRLPFEGALYYLYGSRVSWQPSIYIKKTSHIDRNAVINEQKNLIDEYFRQEKVYNLTQSGLVDIGWRGTLHEIMAGFQETHKVPIAINYSIGSTRKTNSLHRYCRTYAFDFYNESDCNTLLPEFKNLRELCECFTIADHDTVIAFERKRGVIIPRFGQGWSEAALSWGVGTLQSALTDVAARLDLNGWAPVHPRCMASAATPVLQTFWLRPTLTEAQVWGDLPCEQDQNQSAQLQPLAECFFAADVAKLPLFLCRGLRKRRRFWLHGAIRLTPMPRRLVFVAAYLVMQSLTLVARWAFKTLRKMSTANFLGNLTGWRHGDMR